MPLFNWLKAIENSDNVVFYDSKLNAGLFLPDGIFHDIEFIISYNYIHLIKDEVISLFPRRIINLHTSLLPWNKGASPNIWSFIEKTPSGVTIHEIDSGLDTGNILLQQEIFFDYETETLKGSYQKSHALISQLFRDNWKQIKNGLLEPKPQLGPGTFHYVKDSDHFKHLIDYNDLIAIFLHKYHEFLAK